MSKYLVCSPLGGLNRHDATCFPAVTSIPDSEHGNVPSRIWHSHYKSGKQVVSKHFPKVWARHAADMHVDGSDRDCVQVRPKTTKAKNRRQ